MKKVIRTIAAVALMFATTTIIAKEPKLETIDNSKTLVFEWDAQLVNTTVKIIDDEGYIIYKEFVSDVENYVKRFDLSFLPEGEYSLTVENSLREVVYDIDVDEQLVKIIGEDEKMKPIYRKEEGRIFLNYLNTDKDQVKITVYDSLGRKLFKETLSDKLLIEKVFNFQDAFEGEYTIVVKKDSETYYETVSIQ